MKNIYNLLISITCISLLMGCDEFSKKNYETLPIEAFVASFLENHKGFNTNDMTRKTANEDFEELVLNTLNNENLIKDIPMNLREVSKSGGRYTAHFETRFTEPDGFEYKPPINTLRFDVICTIPDSLAPKLQDNRYYVIDGKFISRVTNNMKSLLGTSTTAYTPVIEIKSNYKTVDVTLGVLYFDITSVKRFTGRKIITENKNQ